MPGWRLLIIICALLGFGISALQAVPDPGIDLTTLKKNQQVSDFRVASLYSDGQGKIVGAKFFHIPSGAPIFLLQIETVPQAYMWIDTPTTSDQGLPHALEHLLAEKGTTGRYVFLLGDMQMSKSTAATWRDFNFYSFSSGSGIDGFFDLLHAWLNALYHPDFTDAEAEREFYHFAVTTDPTTKARSLTEGGSVYEEEQADHGEESCYRDLKQLVIGKDNPLAAKIGGDPDQMRDVTPRQIREFRRAHYQLGPGTGFILVIHPKENVGTFLSRLSGEFARLGEGHAKGLLTQNAPGAPKYRIQSAENRGPRVCPVAGTNESAPSNVWFEWKPQEIHSMIDLELLKLFYQGLADGPRSLLYKSIVDSKTRKIETGATNVTMDPRPSDSPRFQVWNVAFSGIPGNRISVNEVTRLRDAIVSKIREVSEYPDNSAALVNFNNLIFSYAQARRRSQYVWMRNSPQFGSLLDADWKDYLDYLEMDPSFVHSLSQDEVWKQLNEQLKSGKNIWRRMIQEFDLLSPPYAMATQPSTELLEKMQQEKQQRISKELKSLREHYHVSDDQEALAHFEQDELAKSREIDQIESRVPPARFPEHPPLTLDDEIQYSQFDLGGVPTIAALFDRPPTIEMGLSFDLRQIPRSYYKYLPLLARSFDSLGLKEGDRITNYSELLAETHSRFVEFGAGVADSPVSHRADLTFRASVTSVAEFHDGLQWVDRVVHSSYLDLANVARLRDIVAELLAADDAYTKQPELSWVFLPAQAFRYQSDALYLALESQFTKAHWDGRLYWLLHDPVNPAEIERLGAFATRTLSSAKGASRSDLARMFSNLGATGLEGELIAHWKRNLNSFPEDKLIDGLRRLAEEAREDLRTGPAKTIQDLGELQQLVVNRRGLHLDLLVSPSALEAIRPDLVRLVNSIPDRNLAMAKNDPVDVSASTHPIIDRVIQETGSTQSDSPWYLGLVIPEERAGNAAFYSDFLNYAQTDKDSLVRLLSSEILAGRGPRSLYMKSREAGLAYALFMRADPARGLILYYADRSLDLPSLMKSATSAAEGIPSWQDSYLVDYVLRQTYPMYPRSNFTFSFRERALAQDIRDGNTREKVRAFYEALLKLRSDPNLPSELIHAGKESLCGVVLEERCRAEQKASHSVFLFVGPEGILSEAEKQLPIPRLLRIWPNDYWLQ